MHYTDARVRLEAALSGPLPGLEAHQRLAPMPPRDWPGGIRPARLRHAAGLLLLFPIRDIAHIVVTLRGEALRHGGQISLPGGVIEEGETFEEAALREAHEEVALPIGHVRTLGRLTPVDIHVSGFRLHPVVGVTDATPTLRPAAGEVARVIEIPVADLFDPRALTQQTIERDGRSYDVPMLAAQGAQIWGATAMVVAEFLTLLGWEGHVSR